MTTMAAAAAIALTAWAAGAGCSAGDGGGSGRPCTTTAECPGEEVCVDRKCRTAPEDAGGADTGPGDAGPGDAGPMDAGPECVSDDQCASGLCLDGTCCGSVEDVCGSSCCGGGEVCFANACVVPGAPCTSESDCGDGQFCERSLGEGGGMDGGVPDGGAGDGGTGDGLCLGAAPTPGRCLDLPPRCEDSGGEEPCIRECEYRPDFDTLNVAEQWHWESTDAHPNHVDVWSTPVVGRLYDTNCDGAVDDLDPPNVIFVSGYSAPTQCAAKDPSACRRGVLRLLDGKTGTEIWSLRRASEGSVGFAGHTASIGDVTGDSRMEIVVLTGEGRVAVVDGDGNVVGVSSAQVDGHGSGAFGWGGGPALADMDGDGTVEVAFRRSLFSIDGSGTPVHQWTGSGGARAGSQALSTFVDLDMDGQLELLAGPSAYERDGTMMFDNSSVGNGFPAVGDFDGDGAPEIVMVTGGQALILEGSDGSVELGPVALGPEGHGGPPTVADFDGDGDPEIGVAQENNYYMLEANYAGGSIDVAWTAPNHDYSSSVTGSTVFDFEGDGVAEVIYNDECFLWVYDGPTGEVRFSTSTNSFTATEASLVADVDGDGHAEIVMGSNGANPDSWHCNHHSAGGGDFPTWSPPEGGSVHRGITVFRDAENSWVGTRALWNQHTYHVTNVCSDRDSACDPARPYGAIPESERANWSVPWLNNFRQNVQEEGLFDAPDAVVSLSVLCTNPPELTAAVRNLGEALLPPGVEVGFYLREGGTDTLLGTETTATPIFPGQVTELTLTAPDGTDPMATFVAKILIDPDARTFRECREDNNESEPVTARCID